MMTFIVSLPILVSRSAVAAKHRLQNKRRSINAIPLVSRPPNVPPTYRHEQISPTELTKYLFGVWIYRLNRAICHYSQLPQFQFENFFSFCQVVFTFMFVSSLNKHFIFCSSTIPSLLSESFDLF